MSFSFTKDQKRVIEDEGGALLVSAAAGSGKTAVLVERAVRMITRAENPTPADRLLILTFTRAAAEEMAGRIAKKLDDMLRAEKDRARRHTLRSQRMALRRASIGTLDSFCQSLVREYFALLDLPPDASVGDAATLEALSQAALAEALEAAYEDPAFAAFAAQYGRSREDNAARAAMLRLYDFSRSLPSPEAFFEDVLAQYDHPAPLPNTPWGRELLAQACSSLSVAVGLYDAALDIAEERDELEKVQVLLLAERRTAAGLLQQAQTGAWDALYAGLRAQSFARFPVLSNQIPGKMEIKGLRDRAKETVVALRTRCVICSSADFDTMRRDMAPMVWALVGATRQYAGRYAEAKQAENALEFSDFEHFALRLLTAEDGGRSAVAEEVSARYDVVMVDEYQDTNGLQNALYERLARAEGDNLFFVGDIKQSIYRFRSANPAIFLERRKAWKTGGATHPTVLTLAQNFRSAAGVINGVNYLFEQLMTPALGEVDYTQGEQLRPADDALAGGPVEIQMLEQAGVEGEADFVAQRIEQMVQSGFAVRAGDTMRPAEYGDFCILLRAKKNMRSFVAALENRGIPVSAGGGGALLETPEVLALTAVLGAIDNPGNEVKLAAAMLGPLFGFSADQLAALRAETPQGSLWGAVAASEDAAVQRFGGIVQYLRRFAATVPIDRLCDALVDETGYLSAVSAMEGGAARRDNLLHFIDWAAAYAARGRGTLSGFMRLVEGGRGPDDTDFKRRAGHVSVLSIHKSKGLEFPVVFLVDTTHEFNREDSRSALQLHTELGIGFSLRRGDTLYPSVPTLAIRARTQREALSEEMRVLYVALTRAKDKLIVTAAAKDTEKAQEKATRMILRGRPHPDLLASAGNYSDWLLAAARLYPGAVAAGAAAPDVLQVQMQAPTEQQEAEVLPNAFVFTAQADPAFVQQLADGFTAVLPRAQLAAVPAKLSVSQLAKPEASRIPRRPAFMYREGLSAAEKGTGMHSFMQFADYAAAAQGPAAEAARLVREGYMAAEEAETLDLGGIAAFFASPLAGRITRANQVLREYAFLTALPAGQIQPGLDAAFAGSQVLVQGIADLILVQEGVAEIVDYKTDHGLDAAALADRYALQLQLYREALQKRLGVPVNRLTLWSFALGREVDLPLPGDGVGGRL